MVEKFEIVIEISSRISLSTIEKAEMIGSKKYYTLTIFATPECVFPLTRQDLCIQKMDHLLSTYEKLSEAVGLKVSKI